MDPADIITRISREYDPPTEVIPGIYIGSLDTAAGPHSCTHVISMIAQSPKYRKGFHAPPTTIFAMLDGQITATNIECYMKKFSSALDTLKMLRKHNHRILIHCVAGINRSATLIGLYLVELGYTPKEVIDKLIKINQTRGKPALTNPDFRRLITARYIMLKQKKR